MHSSIILSLYIFWSITTVALPLSAGRMTSSLLFLRLVTALLSNGVRFCLGGLDSSIRFLNVKVGHKRGLARPQLMDAHVFVQNRGMRR